MRIGIVTTSYPRWPGDSAGSFVEGHARALVELGHEVEVVAAGDIEGGLDGGQDDGRATRDANGGRAARDANGGGDVPRDGGRDASARLVDLREGERRERERRDIDEGHLVDLRDQERRERERRERERRDNVEFRRGSAVLDVVRVPARGLFYKGGAPDLIERSPLRAMVAAAAFMPRFIATVATRALSWDHVIAHWLAPSAIAALPSTKPLTAIAHGGDIYTLRRMKLLAPTIALLRAREARLVFVSEALRAIANTDGIVQPMGIDLAHFAQIGRAPATPPIVLFVGRLVPIKGVDLAIEAMARLPNMQLVIAGDGPERRALEGRAHANRSRGARITFVGEVSTQRRDELLRQASVVVVPSRTTNGRSEGCPTIAIEALAAGVPVVSTIGRASKIVAVDDANALADAIVLVGKEQHPKTTELVADLAWRDVASRLLRNS